MFILPRRYILPYSRRNESISMYGDRLRSLLRLRSRLANDMSRRL